MHFDVCIRHMKSVVASRAENIIPHYGIGVVQRCCVETHEVAVGGLILGVRWCSLFFLLSLSALNAILSFFQLDLMLLTHSSEDPLAF